jgi:hypothetical protein
VRVVGDMGVGCWVLGVGCWVLDLEIRVLEIFPNP